MKQIKLTQGKYALVNNNWFNFLNSFKWYAAKNGRTFYAKRNSIKVNGERHTIWMHREIMGRTPHGKEIDHKDGDGLNNQKNNLRFASLSQNRTNARIRKDNKSGYKGVCWHKSTKKWIVRIRIEGKEKHLGVYTTLEEAAKVYEKFAKRYYLRFSRLS